MGGGAEAGICPKCSTAFKPGESVCSNCGTAVNELSRTMTSGFSSSPGTDIWERFTPGKVFANRYTIIEEIGFGGMGRVYKAIDQYLGIIVALKIIRPEYASNLRMIEHFKKETILARSISSEYVVRVHDLGEAEDIKYISMDFVEGQNLRDLIRASGSLTISTAIKFGKQICSALSAAHKEQVIHRDLKPSNVIIDKGGRVRVMDFGLAKTLDRNEAHRAGAVVGTPAYMSPEQARGEMVDERTDIYALGLILYEMVTGCPVFEADSTTEYIKKHCTVEPELPSRLNPAIPQLLEVLILKCLKKNREERYKTAADVCGDLDRAVSTKPSRRKSIRSIVVRSLVGIFALASVLLAAYFLFFRRPAPPPAESTRKSLAVLAFENHTGDPNQDYMRHVLQNVLMYDLEQSRYLRLLSRDRLLQCLVDLGAENEQVLRSDILGRIASRENVDFFLQGTFMAMGGIYRIIVRITNARTDQPMGSESFDAGTALEDIYDRVDEISIWAKSQLGITKNELAKDFDEELKKYSTGSIEALRLFFSGLEFFDRGDFEKSTECYLEAVAIDENFAMAYSRLGMNAVYQGHSEKAREYIQRAMALRKNLTLRERKLIEGDYLNVLENDFSQAIETYENLLSIYPDDTIALEHLGSISRNIEEWDKAERCFEQLTIIRPNSLTALQNLSYLLRAQGEYEKAIDIVKRNEAILASNGEYLDELAKCYFCQGNVDEASQIMTRVLSQTPQKSRHLLLGGEISLVKGNYREAEGLFWQLLESGRGIFDPLDGHLWLGRLYLLQGRYRDCLGEIQEGLDLARKQKNVYDESTFLQFESYLFRLQGDFVKAYESSLQARKKAVEARSSFDEINALQLMGLCQVEMGRLLEAQETAATMKEIIEKVGFRKRLRDGYYLEGMIAQARGSWDEATRQFSRAAELMSCQNTALDRQAFYLEALAFSQYKGGDLEAARAQYERVIFLTTGLLMTGDAYGRSLLQLARISLTKKDTEKAREYLQKYLAVRAEADAGIPEVEEARRLLVSLS